MVFGFRDNKQTKSKYLVGSILCGLLTAFGIVTSIISAVGAGKMLWILMNCCNLVLLVLIAFYAVVGYKKPHGNMLRYIMLFRAVILLLVIMDNIQADKVTVVMLHAIEIGLMCYIAGRLSKVKENLFLMIAVTICFVPRLVSSATMGIIAPLAIWLDICVAYFLRYKEHKEAGLIDAPKK